MTAGTHGSTLPGMVQVHGTCVDVDGTAVLLLGAAGSGKSDLALRLIDGEYASWYGSRAIPGLRYLRDFATDLA